MLILASVIVGILPFINTFTISIISISEKRIVHSIVSILLFLSLITLMNFEKSISKDTMNIILVIIWTVSCVYSSIAFYYLIGKNSIHLTRSVPSQHLKDILQQPPSEVKPSTIININEATLEQIVILPLLTLIDAKKIVDERNKKGYYRTPEDMQSRIGLAPMVINKIKPYLDFKIIEQIKTENIHSRKIDF